MTGTLQGLRIIELAGIGPGPFAGMMLADHGAEVIRIERPGAGRGPRPATDVPRGQDVLLRSRKRLELDLKSPEARAVLLDLVAGADGLIEGFRPGVTERLGLGPDAALARNPRLVYGRMTGWGQTGPLAPRAGHDLNYIAIAGALHGIGPGAGKPVVPLNLVGDFGGGGMLLAFGMLAGLIHARNTGRGQVIDAAMTDGAALLMAMMHGFLSAGLWQDARGANILDGGAYFYDTYETRDGRHVAIGAIEPQFHARLLELLGLTDDPAFAEQLDPARWDDQRARLAAVIATRTRDEWDALLLHEDVCYAPVLSMAEASAHPHNRARATFVTAGGVVQPAPAPRPSVSGTVAPRMSSGDSDATELLAGLGYDPARIAALRDSGAVG